MGTKWEQVGGPWDKNEQEPKSGKRIGTKWEQVGTQRSQNWEKNGNKVEIRTPGANKNPEVGKE